MRKHTLRITLSVSAILLFAVAFAVSAQTFTEPTPTTALPAPITTTDKGQGIAGKFAVGTTIQDAVNVLNSADATLYVKGSAFTRLNVAASVNANVSAANNLFSVNNSHVLIGGGTPCTQMASQLCIQGAATNTPALYAESVSGNGIFGETTVGNSAGIFAQGYYGVLATATTSQAFAAYGVSCKEVVGSPGTCETYGDAGYFNGDVKIERGTPSDPNTPTGYYGGNGFGLYKVGSLQNKNADAPNEGIMYKYISGNIPSASLSTVPAITIPANTVGIIGVESTDGVGNTFIPIGKAVTYTYNSTGLTLRHATGTIHYYKLVVMYIAP